MTVQQTRVTDVVPGPRTAEPPAIARLGWTETSQTRLGHPCSEYWDVATARWTPCPPVPGPRTGG